MSVQQIHCSGSQSSSNVKDEIWKWVKWKVEVKGKLDDNSVGNMEIDMAGFILHTRLINRGDKVNNSPDYNRTNNHDVLYIRMFKGRASQYTRTCSRTSPTYLELSVLGCSINTVSNTTIYVFIFKTFFCYNIWIEILVICCNERCILHSVFSLMNLTLSIVIIQYILFPLCVTLRKVDKIIYVIMWKANITGHCQAVNKLSCVICHRDVISSDVLTEWPSNCKVTYKNYQCAVFIP